MSVLKGSHISLEATNGTHIAHWKQGSFVGIGGDREQTYYKCSYKLDNGSVIPVFIQVGWDKPKSTVIDNRFQFGLTNGIIFLVLHDKSQTPYQHRFVENNNWLATTAKGAANILKMMKGYDATWMAGDYLRDF